MIFFLLILGLCVDFGTPAQDRCLDPIRNDSKALTALILARGGSKGIRLKNIQRIDKVSLLGLSLTALQETKNYFQSIWVSTDHPLIAEEAERYQVNVHWRSPETATDSATSMFAVQEFLNQHQLVSNLALIQCTSPFIKSKYLKKAIYRISFSDCVFSVVKSYKLRWKKDKVSKKLLPINFNITNRPRRQDWDGELLEAGMFYFTKRFLLDKQQFHNDYCRIVKIAPRDSIEIDKPIDLNMARLIDKLNRNRLRPK